MEGLLEKYLQPTQKPLFQSERAELIDRFVQRLNQARVGTKYKPLTPRAVAVWLSYIPTEELYPFFRKCENAKSFSKLFWWHVKPRV